AHENDANVSGGEQPPQVGISQLVEKEDGNQQGKVEPESPSTKEEAQMVENTAEQDGVSSKGSSPGFGGSDDNAASNDERGDNSPEEVVFAAVDDEKKNIL
ncbi:unnamed protein product, partial [Heterosigma akashiwo]